MQYFIYYQAFSGFIYKPLAVLYDVCLSAFMVSTALKPAALVLLSHRWWIRQLLSH
jgi:hypothetical protein